MCTKIVDAGFGDPEIMKPRHAMRNARVEQNVPVFRFPMISQQLSCVLCLAISSSVYSFFVCSDIVAACLLE